MEGVVKGSCVSHGPCKHPDLQQIPSGQRMMGNGLEISVAPLLHIGGFFSLTSSLGDDDDPEPRRQHSEEQGRTFPGLSLQRALQHLVLGIPLWR